MFYRILPLCLLLGALTVTSPAQAALTGTAKSFKCPAGLVLSWNGSGFDCVNGATASKCPAGQASWGASNGATKCIANSSMPVAAGSAEEEAKLAQQSEDLSKCMDNAALMPDPTVAYTACASGSYPLRLVRPAPKRPAPRMPVLSGQAAAAEAAAIKVKAAKTEAVRAEANSAAAARAEAAKQAAIARMEKQIKGSTTAKQAEFKGTAKNLNAPQASSCRGMAQGLIVPTEQRLQNAPRGRSFRASATVC